VYRNTEKHAGIVPSKGSDSKEMLFTARVISIVETFDKHVFKSGPTTIGTEKAPKAEGQKHNRRLSQQTEENPLGVK